MTQHTHEEGPAEGPARELSPAEIVQDGIDHDNRHRLKTAFVAGGIAVGGLLATAELAQGHDASIGWHLPYSPIVQAAAEHVNSTLEDAGFVFPLAAGGLAVVAALGRRKPKIGEALTLSSVPYITDETHKRSGASRVVTVSAALTASAAALGTFIGSIGTEVTQGDLRPIRYMVSSVGDSNGSVIAENDLVQPMVESSLNRTVEERILQEAEAQHIRATPFDLHLGTYRDGKISGTELTFAVVPVDEETAKSRLDPAGVDCKNIPVSVDDGAGMPQWSHLKLDGVDATVVGTTPGTSSMDRIGVETSAAVLQDCIEQDPNAPPYGIMLDASPAVAALLLAHANAGIDAPAAVMSTGQFLGNSEKFWIDNVNALVGILAAAALAFCEVATGGAARERIARDRIFWAQSRAMGTSVNFIRGVELLHATRTGVRAAIVGAFPAVIISIGADMAIPGYNAAVGIRESALGASVAVLGSVGGALGATRKLDKMLLVRTKTRN